MKYHELVMALEKESRAMHHNAHLGGWNFRDADLRQEEWQEFEESFVSFFMWHINEQARKRFGYDLLIIQAGRSGATICPLKWTNNFTDFTGVPICYDDYNWDRHNLAVAQWINKQVHEGLRLMVSDWESLLEEDK